MLKTQEGKQNKVHAKPVRNEVLAAASATELEAEGAAIRAPEFVP